MSFLDNSSIFFAEDFEFLAHKNNHNNNNFEKQNQQKVQSRMDNLSPEVQELRKEIEELRNRLLASQKQQ